MRYLYVIGKYITFPGAYLRAFWEHMTCLMLGLPVENTSYLRADEMCGHVEHFLPQKGFSAYFGATAPGFMGLITGLPLVILGVFNLRFTGITFADSTALFVLYIALTYIGVSIMCCLYPQFEIAQNLWDITLQKIRSEDKKSVIGGVFMFLPALVTYIGAVLERFSVPVLIWAAGLAVVFII